MRRRWSDRSSRRVRTLVTQLARSRLVRESGRMRADIHDGPEQTLQSEAGYSNARPHRQDRRNLLHRTAGPYSWVNRVVAGSCRSLADFRNAPKADAKSGHRHLSRWAISGHHRRRCASGLVTSRACSTKSSASGLSVRFFKVTIPNVPRLLGNSTGKALSERCL